MKHIFHKWKPIAEGTKVKLNIESIKAHSDYSKLPDTYKTWINENQGDLIVLEADNDTK